MTDGRIQPKRKSLRMSGYDYTLDTDYFITLCTYNKRHIFGEIENSVFVPRQNSPDKIISNYLEKLSGKFENLIVENYVIMPNHIHIILSNPGTYNEITLEHSGTHISTVMQWFKTQTTNEYIKGVRAGLFPPFEKHLWQRGYYEHVITSRRDYDNCSDYINLNPLKWSSDEYYGKIL
ncbi:MAG: transposase [Clostridiales bacterium]|nr:transposase [Clostridiales bacterium]